MKKKQFTAILMCMIAFILLSSESSQAKLKQTTAIRGFSLKGGAFPGLMILPGLGLIAAALAAEVKPGAGKTREVITSADLNALSNSGQDKFMRRVYDVQVEIWTYKGAAYVGSVPGTVLKELPAGDTLPGRRIFLHRDIIEAVQKMLKAARIALTRAKSDGVKSSQKIKGIRIRSGYRSARVQFMIWQRHYPKYYRRTRSRRRSLEGGEHGEEAARFLAGYINERVFSPGYSPHQHGKTIDLTYEEKGVWAEADTSPAGIEKWENSWLFSWLRENAHHFGFAQNPNINEPWHWEYGGISP